MSNDLIKMSDVIDAIELVDWYHQNCNKDMVHGANSDEHQAWYKSQDIYEALENVPSVDRPQGEWIEVDDVSISCRCSVCGWEAHLYEDDVYGMPYCPNCGCRMKGADDGSR